MDLVRVPQTSEGSRLDGRELAFPGQLTDPLGRETEEAGDLACTHKR